jgi:general secretion pathway protein M
VRLVITHAQQVFVSYSILGVLSVGLVFAVFGAPVARRIGFSATLEELRSTYARSVGALARSEAVREAVAARYAREDSDRHFYQAETAALAGAQLQNELHTLIQGEGGMLVSSAFRQSSGELSVTPVSVSVRLQCSIEALLRILHSLEGHEPVLFIENLVIQSRRRPGRRLAEAREELDVQFDVMGYLDRQAEP